MRELAIVLALLLALTPTPSPAQSGSRHAYQVNYGPKDLGTWSKFTLGRSKTGIYDGSMFQSDGGKGFLTVTLSRTLTAGDRQSLFDSIPSANDALVIHELFNGQTRSVITCPKAMKDTMDASGDPGTAIETLTFACTQVAFSH